MLSELKKENALLHNTKGLEYGFQRKYNLAIAEFTRAIYFDPSQATYYWHRAEIYLKLYDFDSCILNFRQFEYHLKRKSSYASIRFTKTLFTWAQILIDCKRYKESVKCLEECLSRGFPSVLVMVRLMLAHLGMENYEKAIECSNEVLKLGSKDPDIPVLRCRIFMHLGDYAKANSDLKLATSLKPSHPALQDLKFKILQRAVALKNEANTCIARNDIRSGLCLLNQVLQLDEEDWRAVFLRSNLLLKLGLLAESLTDLMSVLHSNLRDGADEQKIVQEISNIYNKMGVNQLKLNYYSEALKMFDSAISFNPGCLSALENRALCRFKLNDIQKETEDHILILKLDPRNTTSLGRLCSINLGAGKNLQSCGKYEESISCFEEALKYDNSNYEAYYERARSFSHLQNLELMKLDLLKCLELNPQHSQANMMLLLYSDRPLNKEFLPFPPKDPHKLAEIEEIRLALSNIKLKKREIRKNSGAQTKCHQYEISANMLKTLSPKDGGPYSNK